MSGGSGGHVPRLGPERSFEQWQPMFLAWLTVQQKCTLLLDPIAGSVIIEGKTLAKVLV